MPDRPEQDAGQPLLEPEADRCGERAVDDRQSPRRAAQEQRASERAVDRHLVSIDVLAGLLTAGFVAGLALLGSIGGGMATAFKEEKHREAALITFLVTLSGVVIAGVGSAFWGVVAGSLALLVQSLRARRT